MPVGIIGNNGPIDNPGATKAAQFIQLCDQSDIPLVFMQNIRGDGDGKGDFPILGELPAKSVDTGLGLDRLALVVGTRFRGRGR